jgi:hypothetical protein
MLLSRPKPPQAGAEGQPLQRHSSQRQLSTKVSGPPLAAASTPVSRAELTASACEIHPLKIQKSPIFCYHFRNYGLTPAIAARACSEIAPSNVIYLIDGNLQSAINEVRNQCIQQDFGPPSIGTNWPGEEREGVLPTDKGRSDIIASTRHEGLVYFIIKYHDIFDVVHHTYVCREFIYPPSPGRFHPCRRIEVPKDD